MCAGCHRGNCILLASLKLYQFSEKLNYRQRRHPYQLGRGAITANGGALISESGH
jgi:hypothetical protein